MADSRLLASNIGQGNGCAAGRSSRFRACWQDIRITEPPKATRWGRAAGPGRSASSPGWRDPATGSGGLMGTPYSSRCRA